MEEEAKRRSPREKMQAALDQFADVTRTSTDYVSQLRAKKSELVKAPEGLRHTDQMLLELSRENRWPVLTVDRKLKESLINTGGSYIEVTSKNVLRFIQN